jgi:PHB/PHA accumulation regulator DNA-binding domain
MHKTVAGFGKTAYFCYRYQKAGYPAHGGTMKIGDIEQPVLAKRYANGRLYRPAIGAYLTRDDLITMAMHDEEFVVIDAPSGANVTLSFRPIIIEH